MSAAQPNTRRPWALLDMLLILTVIVGLALVLLGAALRSAYHHPQAGQLAPPATVLQLLPAELAEKPAPTLPDESGYRCTHLEDGDWACVDDIDKPYTAGPAS